MMSTIRNPLTYLYNYFRDTYNELVNCIDFKQILKDSTELYCPFFVE